MSGQRLFYMKWRAVSDMANSLPLFPVLSDERRNKIRYMITEDYQFSYTNNEESYHLETDETAEGSGVYKLIDQEGDWSPDVHNLCVHRRGQLSSISGLFGKYGIVCSNAVIGVATIWTSSDSKQRGAIEVGEIKNTDAISRLELDYEFDVAQLRGRVDFSTILYVKKAGTPNKEERHLANTYGCLLGELDRISVLLDGNGSVFPIYEVYEPDQPLWYVRCTWEDPTFDQFVDCVSLIINTAHHNYRFLDKKRKSYDEQLMLEIMASALTIIISELKEDPNYWDETVNGNSLQRGSVSEAVNYFIKTHGWDVTSIESLSISIHKFFDQKVSHAD